ncbi:MAG: response regulator [Leptolyngbya sp. DLM2.Bin27]|nr:MAG: response regulator [Leptolyngbya sp. DLM2.Bin27]
MKDGIDRKNPHCLGIQTLQIQNRHIICNANFMRILIVEDDQLSAQALQHLLTSYSYAPDIARRGHEGLDLLAAFAYDLVILDLQLPDQDGISLCKALRAQGYTMPVMLLTGTDQVDQKAAALNAGADDYVVKPFHSQELIARVLALLRRGQAAGNPWLSWGALQLDPSCRRVTYDHCELTLTPKEYAVLELLLRHGEQVFSAQAILDQVWAVPEPPMEETVRTHIKRLRQKLRLAGAPANLIETVCRVGYRLNPSMRDESSPSPGFLRDPSAALPGARAAGVSLVPAVCVLVVTDEPGQIKQIQSLSLPPQLEVVGLGDLTQLWPSLITHQPDLLIVGDGDRSGPHLCKAVRSLPRWQTIPILVLLPHKTPAAVQKIFAAGASDILTLPLVGPELVARIVAHVA